MTETAAPPPAYARVGERFAFSPGTKEEPGRWSPNGRRDVFLFELLFELVFGVLVEGVFELLSFAISRVGAASKAAFHVAWWTVTTVAIPLSAVWYSREPTPQHEGILILTCLALPFFGIVFARLMPVRPRAGHAGPRAGRGREARRVRRPRG